MKMKVFDNNNIKLKMSRFIGISIVIFLTTIAIYFGIDSKIEHLKIDLKNNYCDTTKIPEYVLFDIAKAIYSNNIVDKNFSRIILQVINSEGVESIFAFNKQDLKINSQIDANSNIQEITQADSISFKALLTPSSKLYERWSTLLVPFRNDFVNKRVDLFENLPSILPNYSFTIVSDFRQSDSQAKLLKSGWSATPLSAHQFGLAADIAIKRKGRYLKGFTFYKIMGEMAIEKGLTWGGNFVGFVDPGHIQLFENSANMLAIIPELAFEFEPFRSYYIERIEKLTKAGKEKNVEDTKDLLDVIDVLNDGKLCICDSNISKIRTTKQIEGKKLSNQNYKPDIDILLVFNEINKVLIVYQPKKNMRQYNLGTWR